MSVLYIGTFGSFIGFAVRLPAADQDPVPRGHGGALRLPRRARRLAGPARRRPARRPDRRRAGRPRPASSRWAPACCGRSSARAASHDFASFLAAFMLLFVATGVGNGSTYRMIPAIFAARSRPDHATAPPAGAAAAIGIISAIGAYGGFLVPQHLPLVGRAPRLDHPGAARLRRGVRRDARRDLGVLPASAAPRWRRSGSSDVTSRPRGSVATHCPYCALQCAMTLLRAARPGRGRRSQPRATSRPTRAGCARRAGPRPRCCTAPDRLTTPLVRGADGTLAPATLGRGARARRRPDRRDPGPSTDATPSASSAAAG